MLVFDLFVLFGVEVNNKQVGFVFLRYVRLLYLGDIMLYIGLRCFVFFFYLVKFVFMVNVDGC